jgi:SAM-dependent methyltransferase
VQTVSQNYARARMMRADNPPSSVDEYLRKWGKFFDDYAAQVDHWHEKNPGYHAAIASLARFYIAPGARVLELGSGNGDLLAALNPSEGCGIDISRAMVRLASSKYPHLKFEHMAAENFDLPGKTFDYIILSDLTGYLYDILLVFKRLRTVCHSRTRIVVNWYSRLWQPVLTLAEKLKFKYPQPLLNWTTPADIKNLLHLAGFEVVAGQPHLLLPLRVPVLSNFANRYLAHVRGISWLCLSNWVIARPTDTAARGSLRVSVICPCRNEAGNIEQIVRRLPSMGSHVELIFVEGHSKDNTLQECLRAADNTPEKDIKVLVQNRQGKGDAVRLGFSHANGDILMILDADLSVAPEDLPAFYNALVSGKGEFINGSRLVYAKDPKAMRFLNLLGNKFFAFLLSCVVGQPVKDTLCGTKVLYRNDYERIAHGRAYFGEFDPFGDFDLLFGAAKLNLRIVEIPVRYHERLYGSSNISRFAHGWLLLRMSAVAARKLFFIP